MLLPTSHNFGGGWKELFKWVVVQNCPLDQGRKFGVELKIFHEIKLCLHKSDLKTSPDISKFLVEILNEFINWL